MYNGFYRKKKGFGNVKRKPRKERPKKILSNIPKLNMITEHSNINKTKKLIIKKKVERREKQIIKRNDDLHNFKIPFINYKFLVDEEIRLSNNIINFLHVQKTGGRSLTHYIKHRRLTVNCYHYISNVNQELTNLFFIIRDPITRFQSGFNHMFFIFYNLKDHWSNDYGERSKYDYYFEYFPTPNILAESLTSNNLKLKQIAEEAFKYINCINNGYDKWFEKINLKDIKFVIRFENLQQDLNNIFCKHLNIPLFKLYNYDTVGKKEWNQNNKQMKYLSEKAIKNLKIQYKRDYYFIEQLISIGLLDNSYKSQLI
tara:strand:+ start:35280 stop:36221 length:942 start_codon:yes stop_codon:yes gene_type:complete